MPIVLLRLKNVGALLALTVALFWQMLPVGAASGPEGSSPQPPNGPLLAWYDAADDANFRLDQNSVLEWKDKSPHNRHMRAATGPNGPVVIEESGQKVVQNRGGSMLASGLDETWETLTLHTLVSVPPGNSPILSLNTQGQPEFFAAGWTIGSKPTIYSASGGVGAHQEVEDGAWHVLSFVRDKAERSLYMDGVFAGSATSKDSAVLVKELALFRFQNAATYNGKMAELLLYNEAHTPRQVAATTAYLRSKWSKLLPPASAPVVAFVGNSLTTGMYCGNGKTWSAQAAALLPGLKHWNNISQGGITTQLLAQTAGERVDPFLSKDKEQTALVFWEGTNDLVLNNSTPEAAHQAIKDYCVARRQAGWKKIVVLSILPRTAAANFETRRLALNQLLRDNHKQYADGLADVAADATLGQAGDNENKEFYPDGVHLNARGNQIVATIVADQLKTLGLKFLP